MSSTVASLYKGLHDIPSSKFFHDPPANKHRLTNTLLALTHKMDITFYKKHTTTRGFSYNYFFTSAQSGKPTLIFMHGFPSSSWDWFPQATFFQPRGYGLIVPDMLGYAGTDKPTDPEAYIGSGLARDIIDIMDREGIQKAIAIGHDWCVEASYSAPTEVASDTRSHRIRSHTHPIWSTSPCIRAARGCLTASRLANYYSDRFIAFAFFAVGYLSPNPIVDPAIQAEAIRELVGRDVFAYQKFFAEEGADKKIENNVCMTSILSVPAAQDIDVDIVLQFDSFFSLIFPNPPELWIDHLCASGATKAWIEADKQSPAPDYMKPEV